MATFSATFQETLALFIQASGHSDDNMTQQKLFQAQNCNNFLPPIYRTKTGSRLPRGNYHR